MIHYLFTQPAMFWMDSALTIVHRTRESKRVCKLYKCGFTIEPDP